MNKLKAILTVALLAISVSGISITSAQADDKLIKKGGKVFKKCKACHAVGEGAKNKVGPQLNGLIGRKVGSVEGFKYSDAMTAKAGEGLIWTEENLDKFFKKPKDFVPGTKMAFGGLKKEKHRKAIIAYFKSLSGAKEEAPK